MRLLISGRLGRSALVSGPVLALALVAMQPVQGQNFTLLYTFPGGAGGATPLATPLLYLGDICGTTVAGGAYGNGTVYAVNFDSRIETVLHSFTGGKDGADPIGGLVQDSTGNFYGVAYRGGPNNSGTVFELSPAGVFTLLHSFVNPPSNGWGPTGTLAINSAGDLFGTTYAGGGGIYTGGGGQALDIGTIFEIPSGGAFTILRRFNPGGALPRAGLYLESGTFYGTSAGDDVALSGGAVFEHGVALPLYNFTGGTDGSQPLGGVIGDGLGNLYGTTSSGGSGYFGEGNGVVFELNIATKAETVLHTFTGVPDGAVPTASLAWDSLGNLYGTTSLGGTFGFGTVFELTKPATPGGPWTEVILYNFTGGADGANPFAGVLVDSNNNVWGAASAGGSGFGTLFIIAPPAT
jgi:uncharacterized repeat protein (TIGR03803 family)